MIALWPNNSSTFTLYAKVLNNIPNWTSLVQKVTKWLLSYQIIAYLSLFMWLSQEAYQTEQLLWDKFFDLMISSESDEMTVVWPNGS